jgi:hypothetical protein
MVGEATTLRRPDLVSPAAQRCRPISPEVEVTAG